MECRSPHQLDELTNPISKSTIFEQNYKKTERTINPPKN